MIHQFIAEDAPQLVLIYNRLFPHSTLAADAFRDFIDDTVTGGGRAWVIADPQPCAYALVSAVPGLPRVGDLAVYVAPERQRQGLGSKLLDFVLADLQESTFWQVSHYVTDLDSPAAHFLQKHHFFVEHEEWQLVLDHLQHLPSPPYKQGPQLRTYPRGQAVPLFCRLYDESFSGLPWDQPYSTSEVAAALDDANDMLFLTLDEEVIGFAWLNLDAHGQALIEPLAVRPTYRNKGFGRILLLSVLHELESRGAQRVEIGAWRDNLAAIHLYQSLGFRRHTTITYLAYNIKESPVPLPKRQP